MMIAILEKLGLVKPAERGPDRPDSPEILAIADRLEGMDKSRAQYVALFAVVLARAARSDLEISDNERWIMEQILREYGELPDDQAALVVDMVARRKEIFGVTSDYLATREFAQRAEVGHRECIMRCLFAVCAADDSISIAEEEEVRQIASELNITHEEYTAARAEFRDKREVLRGLGEKKS